MRPGSGVVVGKSVEVFLGSGGTTEKLGKKVRSVKEHVDGCV